VDNDLEKVVEFHGHLCPGLALGYRVAKLGLRLLDAPRAKGEELIAIVENDSCAVDAIQFLMGCTFGKGNLYFKDYGKHGYTFARRSDGKAVRISLKEDVFSRIGDREERIRKFLSLGEEELLEARDVRVELPKEAEIHGSVVCGSCHEIVMETRVRMRDGKAYCIPCYESLDR